MNESFWAEHSDRAEALKTAIKQAFASNVVIYLTKIGKVWVVMQYDPNRCPTDDEFETARWVLNSGEVLKLA